MAAHADEIADRSVHYLIMALIILFRIVSEEDRAHSGSYLVSIYKINRINGCCDMLENRQSAI